MAIAQTEGVSMEGALRHRDESMPDYVAGEAWALAEDCYTEWARSRSLKFPCEYGHFGCSDTYRGRCSGEVFAGFYSESLRKIREVLKNIEGG